MATSKTNTSNKNTSNKDVKSLSKQLSQVSAQAKSLGINNADTRKADSMVRQTEAQGSKKYAGSAFDTEFQANEKVINSMTLKPTGTVKYPEYKDTPVQDYTMNNTGLTGGESGITTDGTNLNVEQPKDEYSALTKIYEDYNKSLTDAQDNMTTAADVQKKLERETQIKQLRQEEADYASQINTITANRDAAVLSLEGQGRGQTEGFIGGEQARINREAAIKALPIQAQLAAAQNKVQLAQDHINTWGAILMQDAQNKYNFKKEQFTALKDYLTDVEKMRLSKLEKENDRKYQEAQDLIKAKTSAISNALGQGAPASVVSAIKLAGSLEQVVTATGKYNADLLAQEAQRASIEASRTSTAKNKAEIAVAEAKAKQIQDAVASGTVVLDADQQKTAMSLGKQFEDESKNFKVQANAYNQILASADDPSAAGDLSLLFGYMKMLDPNSVVRETEFANAENAGGIPERIRAQYNKALSGERLTESMRADFIDRSAKIYNSALDQQIDLEDTYSQQGVSVYGLPKEAVDLIVRDIRAQGAVSDVAFGLTLNNLSDVQLLDLRQSGLLTTPSGR